jgi:HSP20 family protein
MATVLRRERRHFPDLFDFADGLPGMLGMLTVGARTPCVEEYIDEGNCVIRAELPGLDPEKDIKVEVDSGVLKVSAERHEEQHEHLRTEFRYGTYTRHFALPEGADEQKLTARYDAGILEITVPITTEHKETRVIPIEGTG